MNTAVATVEAEDHGHGDHGHGTGISNAKMAMWMFLSSEALFFGAFIASYLLYRSRRVVVEGAKTPKEIFNIPFTSATSFILLMSSLTMVLALAAIQRNDIRRFKLWLLATAIFGSIFIGGQIFEFTEFYREGVELSSSLQSSTFFLMTGLHGAHVTVGIIWLMSLLGLANSRKFTAADSEKVEIAGLYWHFVDIVWIVIFTVIYLMPQGPGK
ncbi:MAG: cytochrome c oxidase subunit 3 [Acidimicrobiia bacterium]